MSKFFGYIEGYYGKLLSFKEREDICDYLYKFSFNTYLYAPKEDLFHRLGWKTFYSSDWLESFRKFIKYALKKNIEVVPSISPGLSFDYSKDSDYHILLKKLSIFTEIGARTLALLMDDIPNTLSGKAAKSFSSLGEAHGRLLSRLLNDIHKRCPKANLWFCPTVYADSLAKEGIKNSTYLKDLAVAAPDNVSILWTGPKIISQNINKNNIIEISNIFNGNVIIWDNIYANDYCPFKIFLGPYLGREQNILQYTKGILLNPTGMLSTDSFLLSCYSCLKDNKSPINVWNKALKDFAIPKQFYEISKFFYLPFFNISKKDLSRNKILEYKKALKYLIWEWKSPIQREWYPFFYMLDNDLNLFFNKKNLSNVTNLINTKYSFIISQLIKGNLKIN
jgi:hypothetical protein